MRNSIWSLFIFLLTCGLSSYGSPASNRKGLVGTWTLQSFLILKDGKEVDWCKGVHGLLTYTPQGYMSASLNCGQKDEDAPAKSSNYMLLYAGKFETKNEDVIHHLLNASGENLIGESVVRHIEKLDDHTLLLTGDFGGKFKITWKR